MTRDELLASLAAIQVDTDGVYFAGDRYVDWSSIVDTVNKPAARLFEVGNGVDTVQMTLTHSEMLRLHAALTLQLLADQGA